jgi:predicted dehydrogenase
MLLQEIAGPAASLDATLLFYSLRMTPGERAVQRKELGIAVIGSGRIGSLRARLAAQHPAVKFLAISDLDPARARALGELTGADYHSGDNYEVIERPEVTAVFVSTPEGEHSAPIRRALELGKPVLVEKPLALTLKDADDILTTLRDTGGKLRVGYSRRYKDCFLRGKEQIRQGRLGAIIGGTARVYNSRAQALNILKRDPHATPVLDVLTYYVDLMCWYLEGTAPVEVVARGRKGIVFQPAGHDIDDMTWAVVTFADGSIVNLGVGYCLPTHYPAQGQSDRVELLGSDGSLIIDDDHHDQMLFSEKGVPHGYIPDHQVNMAFLGANTPGEWAMDGFWGPLGNETRAWLDHLSTGSPALHTTPEQARINLETTIAIERAAATGKSVRLPLEM